MNDRMSILLDEVKTGQIVEFSQSTPVGNFTREYEIIATLPDTMIAVQFMCGFKKPCIWNSRHGFRRATEQEKVDAQKWLDDWKEKNMHLVD